MAGLKSPSNTPPTGFSSLLKSCIRCPVTVNKVLVYNPGSLSPVSERWEGA